MAVTTYMLPNSPYIEYDTINTNKLYFNPSWYTKRYTNKDGKTVEVRVMMDGTIHVDVAAFTMLMEELGLESD